MATCYLQIVDMFAIDETLKSCFWKKEREHELSTSRRKKKTNWNVGRVTCYFASRAVHLVVLVVMHDTN